MVETMSSAGAGTLRRLLPWFAAAAVVLRSGFLLFPRPVVGLADNGDWVKIMGPVGLRYPAASSYEHDYFSYLPTKLAIVPPGYWKSDYFTSETAIVWLARRGAIVAGASVFDLRWLGAIHLGLLALAVWIVVRAGERLTTAAHIVLAALVVFVFSDVGYVAALNSIYSQVASFNFLMLTVAFAAIAAVRRPPGLTLLLGFGGSVAGLVASKPQEAPQGPLWAAFAVLLFAASRPPIRRAALGLALALTAFSVYCYRQTPQYLKQQALYHAVFDEVLLDSHYAPAADAGSVLAELGLDPTWERYAGISVYDRRAPIRDPWFTDAFFLRVTYPRLLLFYAKHPLRAWSSLTKGVARVFVLRPPAFGNFERMEGFHPGAQTPISSEWSDLRAALAPPGLWFAVLLAGNMLLGLRAFAARDERLCGIGVLIVCAVVAGEFLICTIGNAHYELERHLFTVDAACDVLVIADVVWMVDGLVRRRQSGRAPATARKAPLDAAGSIVRAKISAMSS